MRLNDFIRAMDLVHVNFVGEILRTEFDQTMNKQT